jgi:hypothetical protein
MWIVKNSKGNVVAVVSRKEDADAIAQTELDDEGPYTIEEK